MLGEHLASERLERIDRFVASTRQAVFVRRADSLLMIRPDKTLGINRSAVEVLAALYARDAAPAGRLLPELAARLRVGRERLLADTEGLMEAVGAVLRDDFSPRPALSFGPFERGRVAFPTLAEIALTYGCQNRCQFCYASSPHRHGEHRPMRTGEVKRVMEKIFHQAHVPSLSFTGGEATLRADLPELIEHGSRLGFRINLITNGIRAADRAFVRRLVDAGLASAQISLEAAEPRLHDSIVGRPGAFAATVAGVGNFKAAGIHVHTNTTLCARNLSTAEEVVRFVKRRLGLATLSMNMVIRSGEALENGRTMELGYAEVGARIPRIQEVAREEGVRFVWYSPIPYCIFNPVTHGLGAKSCACVDGILSLDPSGQVLPCSSFGNGIGSLLEHPFERIYASRRARYWREKRFVPPVCDRCPDVDVCGGGCPLYWDAAGSFAELPQAADQRSWNRWQRRRRRGGSFGVRSASSEGQS